MSDYRIIKNTSVNDSSVFNYSIEMEQCDQRGDSWWDSIDNKIYNTLEEATKEYRKLKYGIVIKEVVEKSLYD